MKIIESSEVYKLLFNDGNGFSKPYVHVSEIDSRNINAIKLPFGFYIFRKKERGVNYEN